jgi:RNA polymerase sigma factor (sigma-70 family)
VTVPLSIDRYESLAGNTLVQHFSRMDSLLWRSLSLIAQTHPIYLQRCSMTPIIREVTGTSHGRRWFVYKDIKEPMSRLFETIRLWVQEQIVWTRFLEEVRALGLYRDTLRDWVENAKLSDARVQLHVTTYYQSYLKLRDEVTTAYLPLVWKAATSHGFTDDNRADLFQIGVTGLLHAAERYHNVGPVTFSTFASRWIRQSILMYISRKMPLIQVSHSVLEEESKLMRRERETGKEDTSPRAQRIKKLSGTKDVLLVEDVEAEQEEDNGLPGIDLKYLPRLLRQSVILRHGLFEHIKCEATREELEAERQRQFKALSEIL